MSEPSLSSSSSTAGGSLEGVAVHSRVHWGGLSELANRYRDGQSKLAFSFAIYEEDGTHITIGSDDPAFELHIRSTAGRRALESFNELKVAEAYLNGDLDIEGEFLKVMTLRDIYSDKNFWIKTWRRLKPLLMGRKRLNPKWIAKHYDMNNIQLLVADFDYNTYTPGIYLDEDDSLEVGAERKLGAAFTALGVEPGGAILDIGSGWGGFLRYAERRGVTVTGITLSRDQKRYVDELIKENNFNGEVVFQDFFTFRPAQKFDGIVMMGVMEDLSDYPRVLGILPGLLKPGGRIYLDFASNKISFGTATFTTKYVWPGTFRMVYMPQFIRALEKSPLELVELHNDRRNYCLWTEKGHERWLGIKDDVVKQSSEKVWRMMRIVMAATAGAMSNSSQLTTAYRLVLELPKDGVGGT